MAANRARRQAAAQRRRQEAAHRAALKAAKAKAKGKPKDKSAITRPPPGYYDPALDAQQRAAQRGLGDLITDVAQSRERGATDFILSGQDLGRQRTELGEDVTSSRQNLETSYGRSLSDLLTERKQAGEDYTANLAQLQRNYDTLGSAQRQSARAAGLSRGGAMAQGARKRAANQAIERAPIDIGYQRYSAASAQSQQRLGQDRQTALNDLLRSQTRGLGALDRAGGQLNLSYQRGGQDLTTQLARAQRENTAYGLDIGEARTQQALQAGWTPPSVAKAKPLKQRRGRRSRIGTLIGKPVTGLGR